MTPLKARELTEFSILTNGAASDVVWTLSGRLPPASRIMSVFISLNKMNSKDFKSDLVNLNTVASTAGG